MKRLLASILAGIFLTGLLIGMPMVSEGTTSFALTLLFLPAYAIPWSWAGLDCPNADSIADKLSCIGISLAADVIAYSALVYLMFWLIGRARRPHTDKVAAA